MDPQHITEFGSRRWYEKFEQQEANHQQAGTTVQGSSSLPPPLPESQFILPIRGWEKPEPEEVTVEQIHTEQKRAEKKRFFAGLKSKFHSSKASTGSAEQQTQLDRRPSLVESVKPSRTFDESFQNLPNELQVQIISSLPLSDILNLRLSSRFLHTLISLNETPIVRHHVEHHVPAYAKRLYPPPEPALLNFHYLCGIWHRLHVAAKLAYLMCNWITKDIFLKKTEAQQAEFAAHKERMRRRLIPLLFTVFHFFETYRKLHLEHLAETGGVGLGRAPFTVNPIEAKIIEMYDDQTLLRVHQVFPLVMSSFCRRLRPPSYVGRVEGTLRGYLREKPADEVHVAILCIGGLRQVERLWEVKGYNTRRAAVDVWYNSVTKDPTEVDTKKRRTFGLGRKKSSWNIKDSAKSPGAPAVDGPFNGRGSWDGYTATGSSANGLIFNTSLAAGMPMEPLSREQLKGLLDDLPILQKIWLTTAEGIILDRKIVDRPGSIRRNADVLIDLIKEEGMDEEDEWLYGQSASESIRPNLEAIDEDALE